MQNNNHYNRDEHDTNDNRTFAEQIIDDLSGLDVLIIIYLVFHSRVGG